jgi:3-deoxy-manno-octulosonate cytidylyltransferase (CMP-KDO synthetase)
VSAKSGIRAIGVIPARWASTRFPGKPLELISGKPLLQWVIEGARTSRKLIEIIVATDDDRIAQLAQSCGAKAVMTDSDLPTGTDRVWQAARGLDAEVIVNIQGDEPLIEGHILDQLVEPFEGNASLEMATLGRSLDNESLHSINTAKIVINEKSEAVYFSRFPIPYSRHQAAGGKDGKIEAALKHIGMYAYRRSFLERFCAQVPTLIEQMEGLEQLRALYLGAKIKVVRVEHDSWGVDTPDDVEKIEKMIASQRRTRA